MDPIEIPINGELDLHTFSPKEVKSLLYEYISACMDKNIFSIRIIHGKGKGILKETVRKVLEEHPDVVSITNAPPNAGGWGATLIKVNPRQ